MMPIPTWPSTQEVIERLDDEGSGHAHPSDVAARGPYKPRGSAALKAQVVAIEQQVRALAAEAACRSI